MSETKWLSVNDELTIIIGKLARLQINNDLTQTAADEVTSLMQYVFDYRGHLAKSEQANHSDDCGPCILCGKIIETIGDGQPMCAKCAEGDAVK